MLRLLTDWLWVSELVLLEVDRLRLLEELELVDRLLLLLLDVLSDCVLVLLLLRLLSLLVESVLVELSVEVLEELSDEELSELELALLLVSSTEAIANSPVSGLSSPLAAFHLSRSPAFVLNLIVAGSDSLLPIRSTS